MAWPELSQITCDRPRLRDPSQAPMCDFHFHAAKSTCAKLKLASIIDLMLMKKQRKKQVHACDID